MRLPRVHIPLFIVVLIVVAGLLPGLDGVHPACAQLSPGGVGLFLDPAGTIKWTSVCPYGECHPELWELTPEGYLQYTVYVLGRDLPRGASAYEFAIQSNTISPNYVAILTPHFPEGASYGEWSSQSQDGYHSQINYAVELSGCLPDQGLITLASVDVVFRQLTLGGMLVALLEANGSLDYRSPGYRPCDATQADDRIQLPIGEFLDTAGVYLPDPIGELSWGRMKTEFR